MSGAPYDVARVRADFPILATQVRGKRLAFLDTAASSQRPLAVLEAVDHYERTSHANVHRGVYQLSQKATDAFEGARERVRRFLNASSTREIIFTRGTTESINLVAQSWGRRLGPGDEILITWMEHHANIVPWQMLCERSGATLKVAPITLRGELDLEAFEALISPRTKLVACTQIANALGTVLPLERMIAAAKRVGALTLVDGAQAVSHQRVDLRALDCDFYAFSSHKLYGPTGLGVLYARESVLREMPPWQGGGDMILTVSFTRTTYAELPYRFEAGTPHIAGAVGLAAAMDYLDGLGLERVQ
ncbi:MAG: aminotransferase class V-fold PLP-dependent enzyme, partial [Gammaproteobacteria bacterium]|nr:aminotransferase class V-fold PLP-dependent enzyme [Gammaproteobacteria bacterium]